MALVERPSDPEMFAAGLRDRSARRGTRERYRSCARSCARADRSRRSRRSRRWRRFRGGAEWRRSSTGCLTPIPRSMKAAMRARLLEASDARVLVHLGACLDHEGWDVRRLAADLLSNAGDPAIGPSALRLRIEDNPLVKDAIGALLRNRWQASSSDSAAGPRGAGAPDDPRGFSRARYTESRRVRLLRDLIYEARRACHFDEDAQFLFERRLSERVEALGLDSLHTYYKYLRFNASVRGSSKRRPSVRRRRRPTSSGRSTSSAPRRRASPEACGTTSSTRSA